MSARRLSAPRPLGPRPDSLAHSGLWSLEAGGATLVLRDPTHVSLDGEVETVRERLHVHRPSEPEAVGEAVGAAN